MDGLSKLTSGAMRRLPRSPWQPQRRRTIFVVEDGTHLSRAIYDICDFLEVTVRHVASDADLVLLLAECQPMAIVAEIEADGQDGCHVMKTIASHDRDLPILLMTGGDPVLAGAADAVEELWGLSCVVKRPVLPRLGELVEFLCLAGQMGRCLGLMPISHCRSTFKEIAISVPSAVR